MNNNHPKAFNEARFMNVNGLDQWFTIRGRDRANPVLFIVGGPGAAFTSMARYFELWEEHFTLVQWDQPGAGATYGRHADACIEPYTLERLTNDVVTAACVICDYIKKDQLIFMGFSGGTILGLQAMHDPRHQFSAFIGCGTFVHWQRQAQLSYDLALQLARDAHDNEALQELEAIGTPPYASIDQEITKSRFAGAMTAVEQEAVASLAPEILAAMYGPPEGEYYVAADVTYPQPIEQATMLFDRLRHELYGFDAWKMRMHYEVPMIFIQGDGDIYSVTSEVKRFVRDITAHRKQLTIVPGAGHSLMFLRDQLLTVLLEETGEH